MRSRIIDGIYPLGARLPGVAEVCEEFDVSTATAVYAMKALENEAFVRAAQGLGYFVADVLPARDVTDDVSSIIEQLRTEAKQILALADQLEDTLKSELQ